MGFPILSNDNQYNGEFMSQRHEMNPSVLEYVKNTPFFRYDEDFHLPELKESMRRGMFETSQRRVCCAVRRGDARSACWRENARTGCLRNYSLPSIKKEASFISHCTSRKRCGNGKNRSFSFTVFEPGFPRSRE